MTKDDNPQLDVSEGVSAPVIGLNLLSSCTTEFAEFKNEKEKILYYDSPSLNTDADMEQNYKNMQF
jgi:hypothetical protein